MTAPTFKLFGTVQVGAVPDSVDYPTAAKCLGLLDRPYKHVVLTKKIEQITLANLATRLIDFTNYASTDYVAVIARVVGECRINTAGFDTDGVTAITGKLPIYGTALYPGVGMITTYNTTSFTIESLADGTVIELFAATLENDAAGATVAKDTVGVYDTTTQALTQAGLATVAFNTELVDTTSAFAANVYTCKNAGNYRISFTGSMTKTAGNSQPQDSFQFEIQKNGVAVGPEVLITAGPTVALAEYVQVANEIDVALIVGDTIKVAIVSNIGGGRTFTGEVRKVALTIDQS